METPPPPVYSKDDLGADGAPLATSTRASIVPVDIDTSTSRQVPYTVSFKQHKPKWNDKGIVVTGGALIKQFADTMLLSLPCQWSELIGVLQERCQKRLGLWLPDKGVMFLLWLITEEKGPSGSGIPKVKRMRVDAVNWEAIMHVMSEPKGQNMSLELIVVSTSSGGSVTAAARKEKKCIIQ